MAATNLVESKLSKKSSPVSYKTRLHPGNRTGLGLGLAMLEFKRRNKRQLVSVTGTRETGWVCHHLGRAIAKSYFPETRCPDLLLSSRREPGQETAFEGIHIYVVALLTCRDA